ncbi:MAG: hypothetical protein V4687_00880 [Bacteroidota bacterium]
MKFFKINKPQLLKSVPLLLLLCAVLLPGCKKDTSTTSDPLTLLTSRSWKRTIKDANPSTNPTTAYTYDPTASCVLDDIFIYTKDGKYNFQGGPEKCDPSDQLQYSTTYTVNFQTNTITQFGFDLKILELTETHMKIAEILPPAAGGYRIYLFVH